MSESPLVSIIIPAYNCAEYIQDSLESVLRQDYPNTEVIVINDGSTDTTRSVLQQYENIITLIDIENSGSAIARNIGLRNASGKYIAFIDSDDYWFPGKTRIQVNYLESHTDIGLVYNTWNTWKPNSDGGFTIPDEPAINEDKISIVRDKSGWVYDKLLLDCIIHTSAVMMRKSIVDQVGFFDEKMRKGQDYLYWLTISRYTQVHKLDTVLSLYRIHEQSITFKPMSINYPYLVLSTAVKKWGNVGPDGSSINMSVIRQRYATVWWEFAYTHYKQGDPWKGFTAFIKAFINKPSQPKSLVLATLSLFKFICSLFKK